MNAEVTGVYNDVSRRRFNGGFVVFGDNGTPRRRGGGVRLRALSSSITAWSGFFGPRGDVARLGRRSSDMAGLSAMASVMSFRSDGVWLFI